MYSWLVPRVMLPLYDQLSGRRVWAEVLRLRELQWRSKEELEARAIARLRPLLEHAFAHVPYYRGLFQQAGLEPGNIRALSDLSRLPIATKTDLRSGFPERVVAEDLPAARRWKITTSGSSGFPFEFYADRADLDGWLGAFIFFYQEWAGGAVWDTRVRIVDPDEFTADVAPWPRPIGRDLPRVARAARRVLFGEQVVTLSGVELTAAGFHDLIGRLPRARRYFISAYPSYATHLAAQLLEAETELPAYPKTVVSSAETLTEANRTIIERAFRCPVVNHYSCWEVPHMAQACPDNLGVLHVNSERVILRVVREDGSAAEAGEQGRVVLTHLSNYVMPFINYDLGDLGVAGMPCLCGRGFPTLQSLDGRVFETIRTPSGSTITTSALTGVLMRRYPIIDCVWQYQAVQTAPELLVLRVVPTSRFNSDFAEKLRGHLEAFLGPGMSVELQTVDRIPPQPSGKHLIIKSEGTRESPPGV